MYTLTGSADCLTSDQNPFLYLRQVQTQCIKTTYIILIYTICPQIPVNAA